MTDVTHPARDMESFEALMAPADAAAFFEEIQGQRHLHVPGATDKFKNVLDWQDLETLINQAAIWTGRSMLLVLDNKQLPVSEYCRAGINRDGRQAMLADIGRVREWIRRGATVILNDIETLTPGLRAVANALETGPGGKVQANLYFSRGQRQGFGSHFDTHDVYAVHIAGEKTWNLYQSHFEAPVNHPLFKNLDDAFHAKARGQLAKAVTLKPGDLLYIPRGQYHDALAQSDASVHVAFSVVPVIGLDVLTALFDQAVREPLFRRDFPDIARDGDAAVANHLASLGAKLAALAAEPGFARRFVETMQGFRYPRSAVSLPEDIGGVTPGNGGVR